MNAYIFDLDDTLVDTSESFDRVVMQLVEKHSKRGLTRAELLSLRAEGGFNCDWDSTIELLRRRNITRERAEIAEEGLDIYLKIASDAESLFVENSFFETLTKHAPLYIVTGRERSEYAPIWASRLDPFFVEVVCRDDRSELAPKPSPAQILDLMERRGISGGYFIGNSVDDMTAGVGAGLTAIGVSTNQSSETLRQAGAKEVVAKAQALLQLPSFLF